MPTCTYYLQPSAPHSSIGTYLEMTQHASLFKPACCKREPSDAAHCSSPAITLESTWSHRGTGPLPANSGSA